MLCATASGEDLEVFQIRGGEVGAQCEDLYFFIDGTGKASAGFNYKVKLIKNHATAPTSEEFELEVVGVGEFFVKKRDASDSVHQDAAVASIYKEGFYTAEYYDFKDGAWQATPFLCRLFRNW